MIPKIRSLRKERTNKYRISMSHAARACLAASSLDCSSVTPTTPAARNASCDRFWNRHFVSVFLIPINSKKKGLNSARHSINLLTKKCYLSRYRCTGVWVYGVRPRDTIEERPFLSEALRFASA